MDKTGEMKKIYIISLLSFLFFSCDKEEEEYPLQLNTSRYLSFPAHLLQRENDVIVAIRSAEEFEQYFSRKMSGSEFVNFSLHTLLLAAGDIDHDIMGIWGELTKLSKHEYVLDVLVHLKSIEIERKWYVAMIVPKLPSNAVIDVKLEIKPAPDLENLTACGVLRPHENIPWIVEMIEKGEAEFHTQHMYYGTIWLTQYKGQDVFVTDMILFNSTAYQIFDCDGNRVSIDFEDVPMFFHLYNLHLRYTPIYTNMKYY
jgi:hypothetical protein